MDRCDAKSSLADRLLELLPQTQCRQCGFSGCRPYADALANGKTASNRCPPGGQAGADALAALVGGPVLPLDPACGSPGPLTFARIEEAQCIGCTLCLKACPVDAIVGAAKLMHTVIEDACTGCGLCLPPCPVDCIVLEPAQRAWTRADAVRAREAHEARVARLARPRTLRRPLANPTVDEERKRTLVQTALARARLRRAQSKAT